MKKKIKQFAKGDFSLQKPDIIFPETHLVLSVSEGETYQGSFWIENQKDGNIRGLVYSSSFRMHCLEAGFEGNPVKLNFTYDSTGMVPGQTEDGKFTVVCNGGEFEVTFTVIVEKPFVMTSYGKVQRMSHFRDLAERDFLEAQKLFRSRQFYDVLKYEERRVRNLYDNMRTWSLDEQALEEFLVGTKLKEKIFLTVNRDDIRYQDLLEDKKDVIEITKNTWGYVPISVETNGDFLEIRQKQFTTEAFVGNRFDLEYVICKEKLHAGNNMATIHISTPYETLRVAVCVHQSAAKDERFGIKGLFEGQALKDYLLFISGRMDVESWMDKAMNSIKNLRSLEPNNEYYTLLQAHIYLRGGMEEEAGWILENSNLGKFAIGRKAEVSAYYLFLNSLLQKDTVSTMRALDEVSRLYMKHPYSWPLLCMLIQLDPKYRNYSDRLRVLERQYFNGSNQVLLYAEAYLCYQENVLLLRKLDSFEIQILNFATKYKIISKELALHAADLMIQQKKYNQKLVAILQRIYALYEDELVLHALCTQLIKGNKIGREYFTWYELAVQKEFRIAQLYEYYMMSMNLQRTTGPFPKIVYLYFMHGINLDYQRTALLYENILTYEAEQSEIYLAYQEQMMEFTMQQLRKRHINASLRVLYNRFLNENNLGMEEINALHDICHKYHVTTENPNVKYVLVIEKDGNVRQRVAYTESGAYVYLYDKESRIVWEAGDGRHYTDTIAYDSVRMFYELRFMELCKKRMLGHMESREETALGPLTFDALHTHGIDAYDEKAVFLLCSRRIREHENLEDDFLLYVCYDLFRREVYDKTLLSYLAHFYCGATADMKLLWRVAREYGVKTQNLAERIVTQMLFSEVMSQESEIFEDYYSGKPYFRLKQAYLAFISNQYVIQNREISESMFEIMIKELRKDEYLADICKIAILKYFSQRKVDAELANTLQDYLKEMCKKKLIFAFYQHYPGTWLREVQLYDKYLVEYQAKLAGKTSITYQIDGGELQTEILAPVYENLYVKEFILYEGETLQYFFAEEEEAHTAGSRQFQYMKPRVENAEGKYGRLNEMMRMSDEALKEAMLTYRREERMAEEVFGVY